MSKTGKIFLSAIGLGAIIVPAILLIMFTSRGQTEPEVSGGERQIDTQTIEDAVNKVPSPVITVSPSPSPSPIVTPTPAANSVQESTPSAQ